VCPGFAEPRSRSELAAADQCLKFCDDTPLASTLNSPRDLDLDCSAAIFLVQWTEANWNAAKRHCGVNGVQALHPAKTQSRCSRSGELLAVNVVRVLWGSIAADGVSSQNFRHWSAEASSDRILGSAKPGHIEPSDWSAAIKTDDVYQSKVWSCWISSGLTMYWRSSLFYRISNENWTKLMRYCQIQWNFGGIDDLCKSRQRMFKCTDMQIRRLILDRILQLLTYYMPFYR